MLKKISVEYVVPGMYIHEFCGSWMEHPFWRTKFLLSDPKDLNTLRASNIKEVWIDSSKGLDIDNPEKALSAAANDAQVEQKLGLAAAMHAQTPTATMAQELVHAKKIIDKSKSAVASMFAEIRMGKAVNAELALNIVEHITDSVTRNPRALLSLVRLKNCDEYTYMHSIAVSAMMIALAKQLRMDATQIHLAGLAGLMHDLGKAFIPNDILNKPGKLTEDEFYIIKSHPVAGYEMMLLKDEQIDVAILDACLHHHEKFDGSGYPEGLKGGDISEFAKMTSVCDVYDAITSNRPYKEGWDPAISVQKMASWDGHFDARIFQAFVKTLGIYPIGSLVSLESDRLGIVVDQSEESLLKPIIKVFYSIKLKQAITPTIVDLSKASSADTIRQREDPKTWDFANLHSLRFK